MEISPQLMQQLQVVFKAELNEHLETITSGLLALEQGTDTAQQQEILENIFRAAHSLKGAAKGVSQHAIADIMHRLESIFSLLKKGQLPYLTSLFDTVLQAIDKIKLLSTNANIDPVELKSLLRKLDECLNGNEIHNPSLASHQKRQNTDLARETTPVFSKVSAALLTTPLAKAENPAPPKPAITDSVAFLSSDTGQQASYTVLAHDVNQLSVIAEEVQTSRLQLKQHLLDFQQLCFNLDYLSNNLNEYVSYHPTSNRDEKLTLPLIELSHLSANALNSYNALRQLGTHLHQVSQSLASCVNTMRLVPFAMLLTPLQRIVRDLSQQQQKKISFIIEGEEIKIDRNLYRTLHAPLVHLINNAIDHGIELPEQRVAQGKTEPAQLRLKITKLSANIVISLSDNGRGIDINALRQKINKLQLLSTSEVQSLTTEAVLDFIFKPGFSLAPILTEISGRGVGLDVVKTNLRKIKGTITVNTALRKGTEFILTLPVSLTSESGILIRVNERKFALQVYNIERVADVNKESLIFLNGKNLLPGTNGEPINIYYLGELLGFSTTYFTHSSVLATVLITDGEKKIALIVDNIIGEQDLIIKPFSYPLLSVPFATGMAILGNSELVPVLNARDLIAAACSVQHSLKTASSLTQTAIPQKILVVDDSPTSRALEKNILEQHGFKVTDFADGLQAWQELQKNSHYDLIVTDIEMPLLNGFELIEKLKNHSSTRNIPTIIVSSLNSEQDKRRGIQIGADAYITKASFDSDRLLAIINQLL
jgi:chemotaxis protein histidine kinase CheA/ActR/RegA family two-component response regulator